MMANAPTLDVLTSLLAPLRIVDTADSVAFTGLMLQLKTYLDDHPGESAVIYRMTGGRDRIRNLNQNDKIDNLFQGKNPLHGPVIYPGDRKICDESLLTVQIHMLRVDGAASHVAAVAVRLPASMSRGVLVATEQ